MPTTSRPGNLIALRELALLWVADEVDVALQRYRTEQKITDVWETRERVVVALTGGPESETVLRRAARIAKRSGSADLMAVHVLRGDGLAGASVGALANLRKLADDVGASFHTVVGDDVPAALLDFARGVERHPAGARHVAAVPAGAGVRPGHRLAGGAGLRARSTCTWSPTTRPGGPAGCAGARARCPGRRRMLGWVLAVLAARPLATGIGMLAGGLVDLSTDVVLFFLATVIVALVGGLGPALLAAVACGLAAQLLLHRRRSTRCTIAEPQNVITAGRHGAGRRRWSRSWWTGPPGGPSRRRRPAPRPPCWPRSPGPC